MVTSAYATAVALSGAVGLCAAAEGFGMAVLAPQGRGERQQQTERRGTLEYVGILKSFLIS